MINLSSYHSNGLPTVVWSNKVNLIGEKVYKPKIHFCEHCNKPILIYGRLIPCKHVFCFTCASLCLSQSQPSLKPDKINSPVNPNAPGPSEPPPLTNHQSSPSSQTKSPHIHNSTGPSNKNNFSNCCLPPPPTNGGCHRCGGKALRVERNTLNSIFVCQVETCRRTYLSARDLLAHVTHRHSKNKSSNHHASSASIAAISSSPYISSSSLLHLNSHGSNNVATNNNSPSQHHRQDKDHSAHHHHRHHRERDRDRHRERDNYQRERERERDSKEYHRQSMQRAAQWAEASAQMMEKGLTR